MRKNLKCYANELISAQLFIGLGELRIRGDVEKTELFQVSRGGCSES